MLPCLLSEISTHLPLIIFSSFRNCENMVIVASVDEAEYRQSRPCRLLGNPIAFTVVNLLAEGKEMNTSEIAKAAGRSVSRVSNILGALRLAEVVRYQTEGTRAQYRLKHPRQTRRILAALSGFVKIASPTRRSRHCFVFSQLRKHESKTWEKIACRACLICPSQRKGFKGTLS